MEHKEYQHELSQLLISLKEVCSDLLDSADGTGCSYDLTVVSRSAVDQIESIMSKIKELDFAMELEAFQQRINESKNKV